MREGGVSRFSVENIWSHSAEKFRRESPQCFTTFGCRKSLDKRGAGEYQDFLPKLFRITVLKNFVGEPFCAAFQKNFGSEKVYG